LQNLEKSEKPLRQAAEKKLREGLIMVEKKWYQN